MPSPSTQHSLVVPAKDVKAVKTLLETRGRLDRSRKIEACTPDADTNTGSSASSTGHKHFLIPVLPGASSTTGDAQEDIIALLPPGQTYRLVPLHAASPSSASSQPRKTKNPLHTAFSVALSSRLPASLLSTLSLDVAKLVSSLPATYLVYAPLLLLPAHAFAAEPWQTLLAASAADGTAIQQVWAQVAREMGAEAVAINAAIPLASPTPSTVSAGPATQPGRDDPCSWNALRSPTGLTPLYGSFGPRVASPTPTADDFAQALWVSTRQNGIAQVWAPLYTMFSRGNIKEKARLLSLIPALHSPAVPRHTSRLPPQAQRPVVAGAAAVPGSRSLQLQRKPEASSFASLDLFAGIGYFAFSHRRAGARPVLCWELNPWSIEGLRRGAAANGWTTAVITSNTTANQEPTRNRPDQTQHHVQITDRDNTDTGTDADFLIFPHTNALAPSDLAGLSSVPLPPIRHVNAGLLPSSRGAWRTAVRAVDATLGGWLHLHENFGAEEMRERAEEVVSEVRGLWEERVGIVRGEREGGGDDAAEHVKLVHLERVKTYAPGVWHVVLDVWVPPVERR